MWSVVGSHSRLEGASMDGSDRRSLVDSKIIWPTDLVIDQSNGRIYWIDTKKQTVESARLDGSDRRLLTSFVIRGESFSKYT